MQKIPTLFRRDPEDPRRVLPEVTPGCEWVLAGEGMPTRKFDGTCVMMDADRRWRARREVKPGKEAPANFQAISTDENTGRTIGWEPIEQSPFAKFHAEAVEVEPMSSEPGTYELCGPKINGNPEGFLGHILIRHADASPIDAPFHVLDVQASYEDLRETLTSPDFVGGSGRLMEGVVWHHVTDGRMAKLKRRASPNGKTERETCHSSSR